jgi:hypothetical protein
MPLIHMPTGPWQPALLSLVPSLAEFPSFWTGMPEIVLQANMSTIAEHSTGSSRRFGNYWLSQVLKNTRPVQVESSVSALLDQVSSGID